MMFHIMEHCKTKHLPHQLEILPKTLFWFVLEPVSRHGRGDNRLLQQMLTRPDCMDHKQEQKWSTEREMDKETDGQFVLVTLHQICQAGR